MTQPGGMLQLVGVHSFIIHTVVSFFSFSFCHPVIIIISIVTGSYEYIGAGHSWLHKPWLKLEPGLKCDP